MQNQGFGVPEAAIEAALTDRDYHFEQKVPSRARQQALNIVGSIDSD